MPAVRNAQVRPVGDHLLSDLQRSCIPGPKKVKVEPVGKSVGAVVGPVDSLRGGLRALRAGPAPAKAQPAVTIAPAWTPAVTAARRQ